MRNRSYKSRFVNKDSDEEKLPVEIYCKGENKVIGKISVPKDGYINAVNFKSTYENTAGRRYAIDKISLQDDEYIKCPNCEEILYFKSKENIVLSLLGKLKVE